MDTKTPHYAQKRLLVIVTGGTIAGNVAQSDVSENNKAQSVDFEAIVASSVQVFKNMWSIEIFTDVVEPDAVQLNG